MTDELKLRYRVADREVYEAAFTEKTRRAMSEVEKLERVREAAEEAVEYLDSVSDEAINLRAALAACEEEK